MSARGSAMLGLMPLYDDTTTFSDTDDHWRSENEYNDDSEEDEPEEVEDEVAEKLNSITMNDHQEKYISEIKQLFNGNSTGIKDSKTWGQGNDLVQSIDRIYVSV